MARPSPQTDRVVQLLDLLADDPGRGLTLAEVSRRLGVHRASCHSMLSALTEAGWLLRDPFRKTYQMGPAMVRLGRAASQRFPALEFARPIMEQLVRDLGMHCLAFAVEDDHLTVVEHVRVPRVGRQSLGLGDELPLRPPYGAGVHAWLDAASREAWLNELPAASRAAHRQAFELIRVRGYAVGRRVVPDDTLHELAGLLRTTDVGRRNPAALEEVAQRLSRELLVDERWVPADLAGDEHGEVSHLSSPVFDHDRRLVLLLTLVPIRQPIDGVGVAAAGQQLRRAADSVTGALAGMVPAAAPTGSTGSM